MKNDEIKVSLIEDNAFFRDALKTAFDGSVVDIIQEFPSSEAALAHYSENKDETPDVILLDIHLPGKSGLESLTELKGLLPESKVIILTQENNEATILQAIALGAESYLLKSATIDDIIDGIDIVYKGGAVLDPDVAKLIMSTLQKKLPDPKAIIKLSKRELEVLELLAEGSIKKEIANSLFISYATVDNHVRSIYQKLQVNNISSAISKAYKMGILAI